MREPKAPPEVPGLDKAELSCRDGRRLGGPLGDAHPRRALDGGDSGDSGVSVTRRYPATGRRQCSQHSHPAGRARSSDATARQPEDENCDLRGNSMHVRGAFLANFSRLSLTLNFIIMPSHDYLKFTYSSSGPLEPAAGVEVVPGCGSRDPSRLSTRPRWPRRPRRPREHMHAWHAMHSPAWPSIRGPPRGPAAHIDSDSAAPAPGPATHRAAQRSH